MKVNLAQSEEQFFYLYLAGSAQRESVYEKLPWIGTEPKKLTVIDSHRFSFEVTIVVNCKKDLRAKNRVLCA